MPAWPVLLLVAMAAPSRSDAQIVTGTYVGNGLDNRPITGVGFQPDVVIIKGNDTQQAVCRTSTMTGDTAKSMGSPGSSLTADQIQSLDPDGFTVGTNVQVNASTINYYWVAFKAQQGFLTLGSYVGNGADNRSIGGVGFQPEWVVVMSSGSSRAVQRSASMAGDSSNFFSASGSGANLIQALEPDGFQVGDSPEVNGAGTFHYIAFNALSGYMAEGSYVGDGIDDRNIAVGFQPEYAIVKALGSEKGVHRTASLTGDSTLYFQPDANLANKIQALQANGFQVGNGLHVNTSLETYYWIAFGRVPVTYLRSIGTAPNRSSPGDGTVQPTPGSNVVIGTGTSWQTWNRGRGDVITISGTPYTVLAVDSNTQLRLTTPFTGAPGPGQSYSITRAFWNASAEVALTSWETCIDGPASACGSSDLVADNRREIGIIYNDSVVALSSDFTINGSTTDALHSIVLTADGVNRHNGTPGAGVVFDAQLGPNRFLIRDSDVTIEWMEFRQFRCSVGTCDNYGVVVIVSSAGPPPDFPSNVFLQNLLIHDFYEPSTFCATTCPPDPLSTISLSGIRLSGSQDPAFVLGKGVIIRNTMIWDGDRDAIRGDEPEDTLVIENCSIDQMRDGSSRGIYADNTPSVAVRNTIVTGNGTDFIVGGGGSFTGSNNTSTDGTAALYFANPQTGVTGASIYVTPNVDLHLRPGLLPGPSSPLDSGLNLSSSFWNDIDGQSRLGLSWDRGADERGAPTAVSLLSFTARGGDGEVLLEWETGSELDNLGFHLYRAASAEGRYEKITASVVPGLGSSPEGARYRYRDSGLSNGVAYHYKLEDIESTGKTELHGPVTAVPRAGARLPVHGAEEPRGPALITFGDPSANALRVVERGPRHLFLELVTSGFYGEPQTDGTVRLSIPGFEPSSRAGSPSIPVLRPWVDALAGRGVKISSIRAESLEVVSGLVPSGAEVPELVASRRGTVRASARRRRVSSDFAYPEEIARLLGAGFQGDDPKVQLELAPLRWDGVGRRLSLARRLLVRLDFHGRMPDELLGGAARARRYPESLRHEESGVLVRFATADPGLYEVSFEDVFPRSGRPVPASALRLSRQGKSTAFHLEPDPTRFAQGSRLYFLSEGDRVNPYGREALYELALARGGSAMLVTPASPAGNATFSYRKRIDLETNRFYQAGLVDAPDLWLWDLLLAPVRRSYPFEVSQLVNHPEPSRLQVWLQGASDFEADPDHHVRVLVNGSLIDEITWDGKNPRGIDVELPAGTLTEGENSLELESVSDSGAPYSMVLLDRFSVEYPRRIRAEGGRLEGTWTDGGTATVPELAFPARVVDVTEDPPRWLSLTGDSVSFRAEAGRRYLAISETAILKPEVRRARSRGLKRERAGAEYLVIGPREFLADAGPLLALRRGQGLRTKAVAVEDIYEEFGFGETSPEAVHRFLAYAYHRWPAPSPRYVLLLGDASYDYKDYLGTGVINRVPALLVRTSYLWTASDPALAAVNGDDILPDLAIGRLPAASREELRVLVEKIVAYETGGASLTRALVLVADDGDAGGDFPADVDDISRGVLAGRDVTRLYLSELDPSGLRTALREVFDEGTSLVSYVGHGGIHLWAQENIFSTADVPSLAPQSQQPLLLTMNCLNGYFHFPYFDSLAEALLKAEGKGAIAAFSPSGLSLNAPAHRFHQLLLREIFDGSHARLGDAVLASQTAYSGLGSFPELLAIYHLLGDPALRIR